MWKTGLLFLLMALFISCKSEEELKSEKYFVVGYELYKANCSNCHQENGKGMANLYPPLSGSEILKNKALVTCIIKYGMNDTIIVNGKPFSRPMPANSKLTEIDIAEIVSFVTMKWGKDSVYTNIQFVQNSLANCMKD